ncbi:MAG TPA: 3-dehydroquinate synthase [Bacillota bacterium]|nr:3-dehydroquinate synthase [Bacillota bacterium]
MERIRLNLTEQCRTYDILIGDGLIPKTGMLLKEHQMKGRVVVITNPTVAQWYLEPLLKSLAAAGYEAGVVQVPDGEVYKSLEEASKIYDFLVESRYDRKTILIALGGGVIGDLAGFVAATYMRGIGLVQIPTTLLAQVDSSIGGKVAVNHPNGKNLIGAFYQPRLVISDVDTLKTLPDRELAAGMAEVVKHGIILDENYFSLVTSELERIRERDPAFMAFVVAGSCRIKADVVINDEKETGIRALLNFGHTIGHSLESLTQYTMYKHGEAVMLGMLAAIRVAVRFGCLPQASFYDTLETTAKSFGMPVTIPGLPARDIYDMLMGDKKAEYGKIRWILPVRLGKAEIVTDLPREMVETVLREMGAV